jgi:hypothetical protein
MSSSNNNNKPAIIIIIMVVKFIKNIMQILKIYFQ